MNYNNLFTLDKIGNGNNTKNKQIYEKNHS